jgi:hypothetical protein
MFLGVGYKVSVRSYKQGLLSDDLQRALVYLSYEVASHLGPLNSQHLQIYCILKLDPAIATLVFGCVSSCDRAPIQGHLGASSLQVEGTVHARLLAQKCHGGASSC